MNRIICDICGCEYAENAEGCPICGYPRQGTEKTAVVADPADRTKVKGGRFSAKNVKKRRKAQQKAVVREGRERSDKPLLIVIALLLIAIVLVSLYIVQRFLWDGNGFGRAQTAATTTAPMTTTAAPTVPCADIVLTQSVIDLYEPGQEQQLQLTVLPEHTTDALRFESSDESVVCVGEDGTLTAVAPGQAKITITCGSVTQECTVVCWFTEEPTAPAETTMPPETQPTATQPQSTGAAVLTLDPSDASCFSVNESFTIYAHLGNSSVSRSKIKWSTSDPGIATVENGIVTPVGKGTATITAEYKDQKAICMVRCRFENPQATQGQEQTEQTQNDWRASHSDVSIKVGESFRLTVKNRGGELADAIWTMDMDGIVSVEGRTITGRTPGTVTLTTTVEGQTFTCIIRVR